MSRDLNSDFYWRTKYWNWSRVCLHRWKTLHLHRRISEGSTLIRIYVLQLVFGKYSGIFPKRTSYKPWYCIRFVEVFVLYFRLLLRDFDQKTVKSGQSLRPLYRDCPIFGVSVLETFHCSDFTFGTFFIQIH